MLDGDGDPDDESPGVRVFDVREEVEDGAEYFGPYTSALPSRTTVNLLQRNLGIRVCRRMNPRGCLYMHINMCSAPCVGRISEEDYGELVEDAKSFLSGKSTRVPLWARGRGRVLVVEPRRVACRSLAALLALESAGKS